ncbi:MAG: hypothetical protein WC777_04095 [Candidatus Gracilibacteria bacterium]|jgi:hypothetical protein
MENTRRAAYGKLLGRLEEPIREVVPALWDLPFVMDTGFTCSGHILREPDGILGKRPDFGGYIWYPHRAMLELAFSHDEALVTARDAFRRDLAAVAVEVDGLALGFNAGHAFDQEFLPYSRIPDPNLSENYNAVLPEVPREESSVIRVETLLTAFWEAVAAVVRRHSPNAKIGPIAGKNFRSRKNWDHWPLSGQEK